MKIKKLFEEMDEDEYLFGKLTNDGGDVHIFFEEQNLPKGKKRIKIPEKRVDVDVSDLDVEKVNEENYDGIIIEAYAVKTGQNDEDNRQDEQVVEISQETQNEPNKTVKMTLRELFNHYYDAYAKESWKKRWGIKALCYLFEFHRVLTPKALAQRKPTNHPSNLSFLSF